LYSALAGAFSEVGDVVAVISPPLLDGVVVLELVFTNEHAAHAHAVAATPSRDTRMMEQVMDAGARCHAPRAPGQIRIAPTSTT